jgi:hypothetical protein
VSGGEARSHNRRRGSKNSTYVFYIRGGVVLNFQFSVFGGYYFATMFNDERDKERTN